jgi:hypothetical protein
MYTITEAVYHLRLRGVVASPDTLRRLIAKGARRARDSLQAAHLDGR